MQPQTEPLSPCRECGHPVSAAALACPSCGAPRPALSHWDGWGFEFRSSAEFLGYPLLHVSFKYRPNRMPVPARGVVAIGQFAVGVITVSQFGAGVVSLSQFTVAAYALAQFAVAYSLIAQFGVYIHEGAGQIVVRLADLIAR